MAKLTRDQKDIILLIEKEAIAAGVDPYFAIALANLESTFRNVPAQVAEGQPASTAFGPFQVNKATAAANGVDYEEMKKNPELAVRTGIMNIARHAQNPNLMTENPDTGKKEIDPARIAAAHRYGESSEYAKTGSRSGIDNTLRLYLQGVADHYSDRDFPQTIYTKPADVAATQPSTTEPSTTGGNVDMGSIALQEPNMAKEEQLDRYDVAQNAGLLGAGLGVVKAPVFSAASRLYDIAKSFKNGTPTSQDLVQVAEAMSKTQQQNIPETDVPDAKTPTTSGGTYRSKTGYGSGEGSTRAVISREELESPKGKLPKKVYKHEKAVEAVRESDAAIKRAEELARQERFRQHALDLEERRKAQVLAQYKLWEESVNRAKPPNFVQQTGKVLSDAGRAVMGSAPVRFGLGGIGAGYNLINADQQFSRDTALGNVAGTASLGGGLASGVAPFLKNASRLNPVGMALTTAGQVVGDIDRGDYDSAKASGYLGALALANPAAAIGALIPTGLNRNEEEELARRRMMPPTITR